MSFEMDAGQWVEIEVFAASFGSTASPSLYFRDEYKSYASLEQESGPREPWLVGPIAASGTQTLLLADLHNGSSDQHLWKLKVSPSDRPVSPTAEHDEGADSVKNPTPLEVGELIYGTLTSQSDLDYYEIVPPEGASDLTVTVRGFSHGAATVAQVTAVNATAESSIQSGVTTPREPDVVLSGLDVEQSPLIIVREFNNGFGPFHWYTIELSVGGGS